MFLYKDDRTIPTNAAEPEEYFLFLIKTIGPDMHKTIATTPANTLDKIELKKKRSQIQVKFSIIA